jgi:hypothetical protein
MGKTIEVYVNVKEVITQTSLEGRPITGASDVHYCSVKEISKTEKIISEEEKAALRLVETLCEDKDIKIQIVNVASLKGKLKARRRGVKSTPTIVAGNKHLVGVPKREEFKALLEQ